MFKEDIFTKKYYHLLKNIKNAIDINNYIIFIMNHLDKKITYK